MRSHTPHHLPLRRIRKSTFKKQKNPKFHRNKNRKKKKNLTAEVEFTSRRGCLHPRRMLHSQDAPLSSPGRGHYGRNSVCILAASYLG